MPIEDIHLALAPNPRVLLGSCAPSSAVSVAGGWWVAAVGFVVVLQRYRSCGSWACPGGLVSGWTWCWGRIWGTLRVRSEVSKSCDWSFSVGSRAVLSTMGEVLAAAGSNSFMALVSRVTKETTCGGIYCRFWHASWTTWSSSTKRCDRHLNCVALASRCNLSLFSDVGPLETIAENKKEQKPAAKRRQRLPALLKAAQQPPS